VIISQHTNPFNNQHSTGLPSDGKLMKLTFNYDGIVCLLLCDNASFCCFYFILLKLLDLLAVQLEGNMASDATILLQGYTEQLEQSFPCLYLVTSTYCRF
jgi:hypothetical protein